MVEVGLAGVGLASLGTLVVTGEVGVSLLVGGLVGGPVAVAFLVGWSRLDPEVERLAAGLGGGWGSQGAEGVPEGRSVAMYKALVRRFSEDGELSRAEERALANLADQLGLEPGRAFALRMEEGLDGDGGDPRWLEAGSGRGGGGSVEGIPGADEEGGPGEGEVGDASEPAAAATVGGADATSDGGTGTEAALADTTPASSRTGDGGDGNGVGGEVGDDGKDGSEGPDSGEGGGEEGLEGRMDLRRNAETGEVEMVIHQTPWGDVRVDLGKVPHED